MCSTSNRKSGSSAACAEKSRTTAGAISRATGTDATSSPSRPDTQWLGASKCVPVCSQVRMLFQYQAGPRSSYRLSSSSWNGAVCANCGGSWMTGVSADSGAVRSMTSMRPEASASAKLERIDIECPFGRAGTGRQLSMITGAPVHGPDPRAAGHCHVGRPGRPCWDQPGTEAAMPVPTDAEMRPQPPAADPPGEDPWPAVPVAQWQSSRDTLQLWTQVVGKVRLALAPPENHWWHVTLYVDSVGLTTSLMPYRGRGLEVVFGLTAHELRIRTTDGATRRMALEPRSVADFHAEFRARLTEVGVDVPINRRPVEVVDAVPFDEDTEHASYDRDAVHRFWTSLVSA